MSAIDKAISHLQAGKMIILVDDEERENEGDLVMAAEHVNASAINFMATHARGLICLPMDPTLIDQLKLPLMSQINESPKETAFTVSIEARRGVTTGISAADRAQTVRTAVHPDAKPADVISPGHIFPLRAQEGGVLVRAGHTEGSVDLVKMAGLRPASVICEIMNSDGSMARLPELQEFARFHDLPIVTVKEVISRRMETESLVEKIAEARLPTPYSEEDFKVHAFQSKVDGAEHLALVLGEVSNPSLVRVHSECLTGDAFGSLRCDCGEQLQSALKQIAENGQGVLIYMRRHEGRGIGLGNKIRAYELQDQGMDTVEANQHLGFSPDLRHYGIGAQILGQLGIQEIRLLTNNPKKIVGLDGYGLKVVEQIPIQCVANIHNRNYLSVKREKLGHSLNVSDESFKKAFEVTS